jgi:small subunit ribosomal protein S24e
MEVDVTEDKRNPLLSRREVKFKVSFQGATPSRVDVRNKLVALLSSDKELTVLDNFKTNFGSNNAVGYLKIYESKEAMRVEREHILERNFPKPKEAQAAEPAKEEPKAKEEVK